MRKIIAAAAATIIMAFSAVIITHQSPASANVGDCADFSISGHVVDVLNAKGSAYILLSNGAVYAPCLPYFGGANGQSYFAGKTARQFGYCEGTDGSIVEYVIWNTQGQTYYYGNAAACPNSPWSWYY